METGSAGAFDPRSVSDTTGRSERVRILAIAGTAQNGSTLVSRMLGELPGFVAVGEIGRLWDKALLERTACSCLEPFEQCPFWSEVGRVAYGGWEHVDAAAAVGLRDSLALAEHRLPHAFALPFLLAPRLWPAFGTHLQQYQELMSSLYEAVRTVVGDGVIVDAMKIPSHVYMLSGLMPRFDIRFVHLVRDSRGIANSSAKVVERQGSIDGREYRSRRGPAKSAFRWTWVNLSSEGLRAVRRVPMIRVRYETFVHDPMRELRRIAALMDESLSDEDLAFIDGREVAFTAAHLVAGNRMRLQASPITLREDAWRATLSPRSRKIVTAMTWPLLRHYGHLPEDRRPGPAPA